MGICSYKMVVLNSGCIMNKKIVMVISLISILTAGCAPRYITKPYISAKEKLSYQIDQLVDAPEFQTATLGILVQSLDTGEILYDHNSEKVLMPASNEKIPTSAVALMKFGPDYKYETNMYTNGTIDQGVLKGDLYIVGSGDPTIGYRFCENQDSCLFFSDWIDHLSKLNIKKIQGRIIGIDDVFDDELIGYGWTVDNLSYYYSAEINGLMLNENSAEVTMSVDSVTHDLNISVNPDFNYLDFNTDISITENNNHDSDYNVFRETNSNLVTVSGKIKVDDVIREDIAIHNPTLFFLHGLKHELNENGISVTGVLIDSDDLDSLDQIRDMELLYTHVSPPFSEILKVLLKRSQNLYAESFVKLLGHHYGKSGSFAEGEKIIKNTLVRFGLDNGSFQYKDGSGLSRYNYISPAHIVKILRGMHLHQYGPIYKNCLPVAGVDGTIGYRMKGTPAQGNIYAKTGTISNVRCLSGYATSKDGENLVFSIMANNFLCSVHVVMDLQDQICIALSSFSRN